VLFNGRTSASQAENEGSLPFSRSADYANYMVPPELFS
jgi:hypothetical protein